MPSEGPMPPQGRMIVFGFLTLFFGGLAFGSLHTARQEYRWRGATEVHGVLVKNGPAYRYEYRPAGKPAVIGPAVTGESYDAPDGVVNDWVSLDYDPGVPEQLRRHHSRGHASTNYRHFLITAAAGAAFGVVTFLCFWGFVRAVYAFTLRGQSAGP